MLTREEGIYEEEFGEKISYLRSGRSDFPRKRRTNYAEIAENHG